MTHLDAAKPLTLEIERTGDVAVVRCHGKLVTGVTNSLYYEVRQLIPGSKRIVLDLSDLTHMDSTGLGALVRLHVSARSAGSSLELINLSQAISKIFALTNLLSVFSIIGEQNIKMGP
jgi:anti-sigma B factor antagonist